MKRIFYLFNLLLTLSICISVSAQNLGIGVVAPQEKLEVAGNAKSTGLIISSGGSLYDYLIKGNASGEVGFRKAHGALGITYIIATTGVFPSQNSAETPGPNSIQAEAHLLGSIRIIAGNKIPKGWAACNGQLLPLNTNQALFSLLGYTYGGSGNMFGLPDLRSAVPIGQGTSPAGYTWPLSQRTE